MADIFDAFNAHPDREPRCPDCGDSDVKFATHDAERYGFTLSVRCNECKTRTDTAKDGEHEALFLKWSAPKTPPSEVHSK